MQLPDGRRKIKALTQIRLGGATLGLRYQRGNYTLEPLVRAQLGRLDTGLATANVRDFVGTIALTRRF